MALSESRHWLWNRNGVYFGTSVNDLPSFDAGATFNPGDLVINVAPSTGQPFAWGCLSGGTSPTWIALGIAGQNNIRTVSANTTATTSDSTIVVTAAATITLPTASSMPTSGRITIVNESAGVVTIQAATGTVNGAASITLASHTATTLLAATASDWASGV